jgi:hypothetical protein
MPQLINAFRALAEQRLNAEAIAHEWQTVDSKTVLHVPGESPSGFDVRVECETSGLYVHADGWHGAPFEVGPITSTPQDTAENCLGFMRTLLSEDSSLLITYAGSRPIRWRLSYATEAGEEREETGLLIFNFLAPRSQRILVNKHLPARYARSAA